MRSSIFTGMCSACVCVNVYAQRRERERERERERGRGKEEEERRGHRPKKMPRSSVQAAVPMQYGSKYPAICKLTDNPTPEAAKQR